MPEQPKSIAFFDLDGTLTTKDTLLEFAAFAKGRHKLWFSFFMLFPWLAAFKTGLYDNTKTKMLFLRWHFKGKEKAWLEAKGEAFCKQILPQLLRPGAKECLKTLQNEGTPIVIVTASLDWWTMPWIKASGFTGLTTMGEFSNGKFTGNLDGPNCFGQGKVDKIQANFELDKYEKIYAYGDTEGDKPMLAIAHEAHYKPFRNG